jgi:hypothetical protein
MSQPRAGPPALVLKMMLVERVGTVERRWHLQASWYKGH